MPKEKLKERIDKITELATEFCDQHLNKEYLELIEQVIEKLSRKKPSPLLKGQEEIWAAGVVHTIGQVNFLYDNGFQPYFSYDELNDFFETKKSTVTNKAADIRKLLKIKRMASYEYMTDQIKENNPMYNSVMVNGFIVPISTLPTEHQKAAKAAREQGQEIQFWTE